MQGSDSSSAAPQPTRASLAPSPRVRATIVFALVIATSVLAVLWGHAPPEPPRSSDPSAFSAAAAMAHLEVITARSRRTGSPGSDDARRYLVAQLEALGLDVRVQHATVLQPRYAKPSLGSPARIGDVDNVVARAKGARDSHAGAVLLMAHYDSVSMSPGASDDGAGVVSLLETARALKDGSLVASDVIFLFTDGEEQGLLGAKAFVEENVWAKDVRVVLNFEGRGDRGPVFMFQTSDGNGRLVRELALAAPFPFASSLTRDIYRRMPNDTDFTEWLLQTHVQGMNFANIDGLGRYHAPTDDVAHIDARILGHHGSYALALTRRLANQDPEMATEPDATFFNVGPWFVRYPEAWAPGLAAAAILSAVFFALSVVRRKQARTSAVLGASVACLIPIGACALAAAGVNALVGAVQPEHAMLTTANASIGELYAGSFAALGVLVTFVAYLVLSRRVRLAELAAGTGLAWSLAVGALALYMPAGAYLVTWPLLTTTLAWSALAWSSPAGLADGRPLALAVHVVSAIPVAFFLGPIAAEIFVAFGAPASPAIAVVVSVAMGLMMPALYFVLAAGRGIAPLAALAAFVVLGFAARMTTPFDRENPRPDTLLFAVDHDAEKSYWVTTDAALDAWTETRLAGAVRSAMPSLFPMRPDAQLLHREVTPWTADPAAEVAITRDERGATSRSVTVHVAPPEGTELAAVYLGADARVARASVKGKDIAKLPGGGVAFYYTAPPRDGFDVELSLGTAEAARIRVVVQRSGLPAIGSEAQRTRPPGLMARPGTLPPFDELENSDMTVVAKSFLL